MYVHKSDFMCIWEIQEGSFVHTYMFFCFLYVYLLVVNFENHLIVPINLITSKC